MCESGARLALCTAPAPRRPRRPRGPLKSDSPWRERLGGGALLPDVQEESATQIHKRDVLLIEIKMHVAKQTAGVCLGRGWLGFVSVSDSPSNCVWGTALSFRSLRGHQLRQLRQLLGPEFWDQHCVSCCFEWCQHPKSTSSSTPASGSAFPGMGTGWREEPRRNTPLLRPRGPSHSPSIRGTSSL